MKLPVFIIRYSHKFRMNDHLKDVGVNMRLLLRLLLNNNHLGDPGIDGRIIIKCIFTKWNFKVWNGSS
jgi:hypothetical protein